MTVALPGGELAPVLAGEEHAAGTRETLFDGERVKADLLRGRLDHVSGPAVCELPEATLVVAPGWSGTTDDDGTIVLERDA